METQRLILVAFTLSTPTTLADDLTVGRWRKSAGAVELSEHLASDMRISPIELFYVERGGASYGQTFAHWHLALAYAKYLGPAFHMACNDVIRSHCKGVAIRYPLQTPVVFNRDQETLTTSLAVAEAYGKQHKNVLAKIDELQNSRGLVLSHEMFVFHETSYQERGKDERMVEMNEEAFSPRRPWRTTGAGVP